MSIRKSTYLVRASVPALAALFALSPAWASAQVGTAKDEQAGSEMEEIIVTARKREERLIDVPETITAFSSQALERAGIVDIEALGRNLPGIVLNKRNDNEPNVVIRGVGAFGNTQGVGFYVDDIRNITDQSARLVDLETVEVLKGPQGTLYGGSSIGGAVKFTTKKPGPDVEGGLQAELGGQDIFKLSGSVNLPLVQDRAMIRVSAYSDRNGGYLWNPHLRLRPDESTEEGVRGALRLVPDDATEILASIRYNRLKNGGTALSLVDSPDEYSKIVPLSERTFNEREVIGGSLSISREIGSMTLTSLTSYTERDSRILWDIDWTAEHGVSVFQPTPITTKFFTQELRLSSDADSAFSWIAGLYYSRVRDPNFLGRLDVYAGVPVSGEPTLKDFPNNFTTTNVQYAAFGTVNYRAGPWELSGGARVDRSEVEGKNFIAQATMKNNETLVLPKASLAWHGDDLLVYATVARGSEPGKLTLTLPDRIVPYQSERSTNYELGIKGTAFDRALSYELAGFYIDYRRRQFESRVVVDGVFQEVVDNIGDSTSYGLEAAGSWRATDALSFSLSASYLEAEWDSGVYYGEDVGGRTPPNSPRFSGNASVDFSHPVAEGLMLRLRAEAIHMGSFYWDVPNRARQKAYQLVNLRAALADADGRWELAARIENVFDEKYNLEFYDDLIEDASGVRDGSRLAQPRLATVSLSYRF